MRVFFDPSALAKRYVDEAGTAEVLQWCDRAGELALAVTAVPELISAFCRLQRERRITAAQYRRLKAELMGGLADALICELTPRSCSAGQRSRWSGPVRHGSIRCGRASPVERDLFVFQPARGDLYTVIQLNGDISGMTGQIVCDAAAIALRLPGPDQPERWRRRGRRRGSVRARLRAASQPVSVWHARGLRAAARVRIDPHLAGHEYHQQPPTWTRTLSDVQQSTIPARAGWSMVLPGTHCADGDRVAARHCRRRRQGQHQVD